MIFTMTALPFILPVVCPTVLEYRNETCPAFPPHDAIPSLQIFSADWAIWSGRAGFKKITETYRAAHNYRDELEPKFYSDASSFQVTLYNLNYGTAATANKVTIEDENVAIEVAIDRLNASQGTIAKAKAVFANMGVDGVFGRSDIAAITKDSVTAAGNLITKLKNADLIEPVSGFGKGKYKFIAPKE